MVVLDDLIDIATVDIVVSDRAYLALEPKNPAVAAQLLAPHAHLTCWDKHAMPPRFHYGGNARIPSIVCVPEDGWLVVTRQDLIQRMPPGAPFLAGAHGYDPSAPDMAALFLAHGPSFKKAATMPVFDNVDVYPLLAYVTGIKPEKNDGSLAPFGAVLRDAGGS